MRKTEIVLIGIGILISATTTLPGAFVLAGILIGGAFTSATQRSLREGNERLDQQLEEINQRLDERKMKENK